MDFTDILLLRGMKDNTIIRRGAFGTSGAPKAQGIVYKFNKGYIGNKNMRPLQAVAGFERMFYS